MTPEVKAKLQELLERLEGKGGQFDWYYQEFPRRNQTVPHCIVRRDGDLPDDARLWDPITGEAKPVTRATPDVSNDRAERDQANRNAAAHAGSEQPECVRACTCSGVRDGGPCNCPWNTAQ